MSRQTLYQWLTSHLRDRGELQRDITDEQLKKLVSSGLLTDLFSIDETKIDGVDRAAFRKVLNLTPVPTT